VKKDAVRKSSPTGAIDEAEMNTLLSQYLPEPVNAPATQPTGSLPVVNPGEV